MYNSCSHACFGLPSTRTRGFIRVTPAHPDTASRERGPEDAHMISIESSCHGALHFLTVFAPATARARLHPVCKRTDPIAARCHTASETCQRLSQRSTSLLQCFSAIADRQQTVHPRLFHVCMHFTRAAREKGTLAPLAPVPRTWVPLFSALHSGAPTDRRKSSTDACLHRSMTI